MTKVASSYSACLPGMARRNASIASRCRHEVPLIEC